MPQIMIQWSINWVTILKFPWCCKPNLLFCTHPQYLSQGNPKTIWHTKGTKQWGTWWSGEGFCWLGHGAWHWGSIIRGNTGDGGWRGRWWATGQLGWLLWGAEWGGAEGVGCEYTAHENDVDQGVLVSTPNPTQLTCQWSYARWPLLSKTLWPSSFHSCTTHWLPTTFLVIWCHTMSLHGGTQHSTCSTSQSSITQQSIWWQQLRTLTSVNMNCCQQNGGLLENFVMSYRYSFVLLYFHAPHRSNLLDRSSKMPPSFSRAELQVSQQWFLPWTTLTRSLPLSLTVHINSPSPSMPLLLLARRQWTNIIRRLITRKSTGSLWVSTHSIHPHYY